MVLSLLNKKAKVIKRAKFVQNTYIIGHLTRYFICNIFFYYNKACINMKIRHSIVITKLLPSRHKYHIVFIFFNIVTTWDYFFESCFTGECPCVAHCVGQGDLLQLWVERRPVWWAFPHSRQLHSWPQQVRICHILDSYIIDPNRWEFVTFGTATFLTPSPTDENLPHSGQLQYILHPLQEKSTWKMFTIQLVPLVTTADCIYLHCNISKSTFSHTFDL